MKTTLMVMDSSGDTRIEFEPAEVDAKATKEAKELFDRLTAGGARAFQIGEKSDKIITNFNDVQGEVVIVPRIVGG